MSDPLRPKSTIHCPIDDCTWTYDITLRNVPAEALAGAFGPGVMAAVAAHQDQQRTEREVELHMDRHKPIEFLRTITRLNGLLDDMSRALAYMEECAR